MVISCELLADADETPWTTEAPWSENTLQAVKFALTQLGPHDVWFIFDGRSRT